MSELLSSSLMTKFGIRQSLLLILGLWGQSILDTPKPQYPVSMVHYRQIEIEGKTQLLYSVPEDR